MFKKIFLWIKTFFPKKFVEYIDYSNILGEENAPHVEAKNFKITNNGEIEEIPETTS